MKGIVFSEFVEMVEETFSPDIADQIIESSKLSSGGAYTSVGTYDHQEILTLVGKLSELTDTSVPDLVKAFGMHLAGRFTRLYPVFFEGISDTFGFLATIEDRVHKEVLKLYPDAELPTFEASPTGDRSLHMIYRSRRPFSDLAEGLILGCADYFGNRIGIHRDDTLDGIFFVTTFQLELTA